MPVREIIPEKKWHITFLMTVAAGATELIHPELFSAAKEYVIFSNFHAYLHVFDTPHA